MPKNLIPQLKEKFAEVCKEIMKKSESHIEQQGMLINDIVNMLLTFKNGHTVFSDNDFTESESFRQLSRSLLMRTSIYDYSALEFFINTIKCEQAKKMLQDFVQHFENSFMTEMNLLDDYDIYSASDYSEMSFGEDQPLVIKYRGHSLSYDDRRLIKNFVCEMFELVLFSLTFERIARGCLALIYRVSKSVQKYLLEYRITAGKLASSADYNISHFIIGDFELKVPLRSTDIDEVCAIFLCCGTKCYIVCVCACMCVSLPTLSCSLYGSW